MAIPGLPESVSIGQAVGAAYDEVIPLPGIEAANTILAVIGSAPGQPTIGYDVSLFEAADGSISSESQDTDGYTLTVIWY